MRQGRHVGLHGCTARRARAGAARVFAPWIAMAFLIGPLAAAPAADTSDVNAVYSPRTWAGVETTPFYLCDAPGSWSETTNATEFTSNLFSGVLFGVERAPAIGPLVELCGTEVGNAAILLRTRVTSCTPVAITRLDRHDQTLVWYIVRCQVMQTKKGEWASPSLDFVVAGRPNPTNWPFIRGLCHEFGIERQQGRALIVAARALCPIPSMSDLRAVEYGQAAEAFLGGARRPPRWRRIIGSYARQERQIARCRDVIDEQRYAWSVGEYQRAIVYGDRFLVITTVSCSYPYRVGEWSDGRIVVCEWPTGKVLGFFDEKEGWLWLGDRPPPGVDVDVGGEGRDSSVAER